jgi:hypothetical protein
MEYYLLTWVTWPSIKFRSHESDDAVDESCLADLDGHAVSALGCGSVR